MDGLIGAIESELIPLIEHVAPTISSVLISPFAGIMLDLINHLFGVNGDDIQGLKKILTDPEKNQDNIFKLKALEQKYAAQFSKLVASNYQTEVLDRMNARKQAVIFKDFLRHMAYLITAGFFIALFMLFAPITISTDEKNLLSMLVGMLASKWQTIIDFFYGSHQPQGESHERIRRN